MEGREEKEERKEFVEKKIPIRRKVKEEWIKTKEKISD